MATITGQGELRFPNGAVVETQNFDDGTVQITVTLGPGGAVPPGVDLAAPNVTVKQG